MSLRLFGFIQGYLIIKVSGFSVERFINLAMNRNIFLSDIRYKNNYVIMKVSVKGFRLLKPIAKKTRCNVKILKKCGIPFLLHRYRKRKILFAGIIGFVIFIYILSTKIWLVNINGLERVDYNTFESFLEQEGLYVSSSKSKVDTEKVKEDILNEFEDVAWIDITIKGTKAEVSVKETIAKKENLEKTEPSNIIAKKEGIIESVVVRTGTPVVKKNDVVKQGDVLIEGILKVSEDEFGVIKNYVPSNGEVYAKTFYTYKFTIPYVYEVKEYTGKKIVNKRYKIFNKNFDLFNKNVKYKNYNRVSEYDELKLGQDYPLPFITIKDTYKEFNNVKKTRSFDETKILALKIADSKIMKELGFDVNIVDKKIDLSDNEEGIEVTISIDALENIVDWTDLDVDALENQKNDDNNINSNN